jgi:hypothetical protein
MNVQVEFVRERFGRSERGVAAGVLAALLERVVHEVYRHRICTVKRAHQ